MLRRATFGLGLCLCILWGASIAPCSPLKAGVARVDITPPAGLLMWGYSARRGVSEGTLDPLYARVLVLETGEKRFGLVVLDLGRTFGGATLEKLRQAARNSSGISYLAVVATHTHSGPVILEEYPPGQMPAWESAASEKITRAIDEARHNAVEARLGSGTGVTAIGHNRRRVNSNGTVTMLWRNETMVPTAPVDRTVSVLRVDDMEGKPLAVLVNYACHPVVFGPDNLKYSADFPATMAKRVEAALEGEPLCFFLQGAPGDINPFYDKTPDSTNGIAMRDWTGEQLGAEAARVAKTIRTEADPSPTLDFSEDILLIPLRWNQERLREALLRTFGRERARTYAARIREELPLPVMTVLINKKIALMGMPGEPFVDFQINWRDRSPVQAAFFLGYANGHFGYFPTLRAASEGGYGAASSNTWVEPGAGERMVDHAIRRVYEMLGRLRDIPEGLK